MSEQGEPGAGAVHRGRLRVALTFDDGPAPGNTPRLLDLAAEHGVALTFFILGCQIALAPGGAGIVKRIAAEGHEIGNHSWSHRHFPELSKKELREELRRTDEAIVEAGGPRPKLVRPPFGTITDDQRAMIENEWGYSVVRWHRDPRDWEKLDTETAARRITVSASMGGIVVCHDTQKATAEAMPAVLEKLRGGRFQLVTVSEYLKSEAGGLQAAPGPGTGL